jgi:hypothetical protein
MLVACQYLACVGSGNQIPAPMFMTFSGLRERNRGLARGVETSICRSKGTAYPGSR